MMKIEKITSRDNVRLIAARKVRDGKDRSRTFIEGRRLVEEALRSDLEIDECLFSSSFSGNDLLERILQRDVRTYELTDKVFGSIADTSSPQGIALIASRPAFELGHIDERLKSRRMPLVVFLKEINNPANLGAILRTAEAANIAGIILSENSADPYSPKAIRAAMGSGFRMPVVTNIAFGRAAAWARERDLVLTACDTAGQENYSMIDLTRPRLLFFGSEAHGLDGKEIEALAERISIPMDNGVESLNLAVSAGIVLFEGKRQWELSLGS